MKDWRAEGSASRHDRRSSRILNIFRNFFQDRPRASLWAAVVVALAVRLAVMAFLYPERLDPARDHWHFAGETGRVARSLALGQGFANPLFADTGPTAWLGPVFPALLAGIFRLFGIYTMASLLAVLSLDCVFSALTCLPVYAIARKCFDRRTAQWSAWLWAFFPFSIFFAADFVWATTLSTLLMPTLFALALSLPETRRTALWLGFGVLYGVAALNDPVVLGVLPVLLLWACYRRWRLGFAWLPPGALAAAAVLLTLLPWGVRNYTVFHQVIPVRDGIGLEFYYGNNADTWHWNPPGHAPSNTEAEWRQYRQLGEIAYMHYKQAQAFAFIGAHRGLYAVQTLRRAVYIWTGFWSFSPRYLTEEPMDPCSIVFCTSFTLLALLGLRRALRENAPAAVLFLFTLALFPAVYYFTHPDDYYRRPVDGLMVVLSAYWLSRPRKAQQARPVAIVEEDAAVLV